MIKKFNLPTRIFLFCNAIALVIVVSKIIKINPYLFSSTESLTEIVIDPRSNIFKPYSLQQFFVPISHGFITNEIFHEIEKNTIIFKSSADGALISSVTIPATKNSTARMLLKNEQAMYFTGRNDLWKISIKTLRPDWVVSLGGRAKQILEVKKNILLLVHGSKADFLVFLDENAELLSSSRYLSKSSRALTYYDQKIYLCDKNGTYSEVQPEPNNINFFDSLSEKYDVICSNVSKYFDSSNQKRK